MKKLLIGFIAVTLLFFAFVYILIPKKFIFSDEIKTPSSVGCVQRMTGNGIFWEKWLPKSSKRISATEYVFNNCTFSFPSETFFSNSISIKYKTVEVNSMFFTQVSGDATQVSWSFSRPGSNNPFSRISDYIALKHIKTSMQKIMQNMQIFFSSNRNIYGVDIHKTTLPDSTLIAIKTATANYPTVTEIYSNIDKLRNYAIVNGATATNAPMLNIYKEGISGYSFMVALPVNKDLPSKENIICKRMLAYGKFLETENIKGGTTGIDLLIKELENYRSDYGALSPAIPFQSLITDRSKEPDSNKWITRLYYPVF